MVLCTYKVTTIVMMMMILQYRLLAFQSRIAHKLHYSFSVSKLEMLFFYQKVLMGSNYKEHLSRISHGVVYC